MADFDLLSGLAKEAKQDSILSALASILSELTAKIEEGGTVSLSAASLSALEQITATVANWPSDYPDAATLAKVEAVRLLLAGTLAVSASSLPLPTGAATESKLESVRALLAGTLAVSAASLPLPAGAATDASLASILSALVSAAGGIFAEDSPHTSGDMGRLVLGIRWDSDTPTAGDGDYTALKLDEAGRLKVAAQPASVSPVTGNIAANGGIVAIECKRFSNLSVSMSTASLAGHNVSFECSNNSTNGTDGTWYGVQAVRSNANTVETTSGVLAATPAYMWHVNVGDYAWFRVRATAHTSGTASYILRPGAFATEPIPGAQVTGTQPVSFTQPALVAGTAAVGDVGMQYRANATGAASSASILSPATPAGASIKGSAGRLLGLQLQNSSSGVRSVKLFNATSVTMGTTSALFEVDIPAGGRVDFNLPGGVAFSTGIMWAVTAAKGLTDNTATGLAANDVSGSAFYA